MTLSTPDGPASNTLSVNGRNGVSILGVGACVPVTRITNEDLTALVDTSDEWIVTRTGIRTRHIASGDESVADLAIGAAKDILRSAGVDGSEVDLIIIATSTSDTIYPAVSAQVQHAIGAVNAAGFDMALACSGFVFGLITAHQFLKTGLRKTALVIGADIHSRYTNWYDRNTCVLFGDGAGGVLLRGEPGVEDNILASDMRMDGSKGMELTLFTNTENCPLVEPRTPVNHYVYMNGREVFKFAVGTVPHSIESVLATAGLSMSDIDHVVLHQANVRIMQAMSEKLNIPQERLVVNLDKVGNTSAASIPIALNEAVLEGRIRPGELLVFCGFGGGLAWASTILRWTAVDRRLPPAMQAEMNERRNNMRPLALSAL